MKKLFFFCAAVLLLGMQQANAWGYKNASDGWAAVYTSFTQQADFYTPALVNEPSQWDVFMGTNPGDGFNITQNNDGTGQKMYVGLSGTAATDANTIVRATAKWDGGLYCNHTVVIPEGKIWVTPAGGAPVLMVNRGNYQFEAIVPLAATVSLNGGAVSSTAIESQDGMPGTGLPGALQLQISNVPVSATAGNVRVKYNLWKNQVTVEDFLSEICGWAYEPATFNGNTSAILESGKVLFTWETLPNKNIRISIAPHPDNILADNAYKYASFRGNSGMAISNFRVNGVQNNTNQFFTSPNLAGDDKTYKILVPTSLVKEGDIITYYGGNLEYKTTDVPVGQDGNNIWVSPAQGVIPAYTYGSNCTGIYVTKLATPTGLSVDASNVLTFTTVANADEYIVRIAIGSTVLKTINALGSGVSLDFPFSGTFDVTVTASDNSGAYANSDASTPYSWVHSVSDGVVGASSYCDAPFGTADITITIETATEATGSIQVGDILFTLSGAAGAGFREQGARLANITVGGVAGAGVLTKVSGNLDNPNVFRPISGITIPQGTSVVYAGEFEARTDVSTNVYGNRNFSYVYGANCSSVTQLATPTDVALNGSNELSFSPVTNAGSYTVYIMASDNELLRIQNFISGSVINFPLNGSFTIKVRAITSSADYLNSELSTGVALNVSIADATVGNSDYCKYEINPGAGVGNGYADDSDLAYLSWNTAPDGSIVVNIYGTTENEATTRFRSPGINVANLTIGGVPAANIVTHTGANTTAITLTPVTGVTIPKGTLIAYSGYVTYYVKNDPEGTLDDLYPTYVFNYVYGSVCDSGEGTSVSSVSSEEFSFYPNPAKDVLNFSAELKEVNLYSLQGQLVLSQQNASSINVSALARGMYIIRAIDDAGKQISSKVEIR